MQSANKHIPKHVPHEPQTPAGEPPYQQQLTGTGTGLPHVISRPAPHSACSCCCWSACGADATAACTDFSFQQQHLAATGCNQHLVKSQNPQQKGEAASARGGERLGRVCERVLREQSGWPASAAIHNATPQHSKEQCALGKASTSVRQKNQAAGANRRYICAQRAAPLETAPHCP